MSNMPKVRPGDVCFNALAMSPWHRTLILMKALGLLLPSLLRTPDLTQHPWFVPPPPDPRHAVTIRGLPPGSTEEVAPVVWFMRNVGGYNAMFARVGDCVAVFDAAATFGSFGKRFQTHSRAVIFQQ
jgi:hypothetical protein